MSDLSPKQEQRLNLLERKAKILLAYVQSSQVANTVNRNLKQELLPCSFLLQDLSLSESEKQWIREQINVCKMEPTTHQIEDLPLSGIVVPRQIADNGDIGAGDRVLINNKTHTIEEIEHSDISGEIFDQQYCVYLFEATATSKDTEP